MQIYSLCTNVFLGRFPLDKKVSTTISFVLKTLLQISWFVLDENFHTKNKKIAIIDKYENPKKIFLFFM